jgi:hypothetical protein
MYVDDSGSPSIKDNSDYYVISGVIIHETNVYPVEELHRDTRLGLKNSIMQKSMFMIYSRDRTNSQD